MLPPRWLLRGSWAIHRGIYEISGHRIGALRPARGRVGSLFLLTTGRTTGALRRNGLYYLEDGPNLVVVASNGGADVDPAWWRNLQAAPAAAVEIGPRPTPVRGRPATAEEAARLWPRLVQGYPPYAEYRQATARPIPVVILEPREAPPGSPG